MNAQVAFDRPGGNNTRPKDNRRKLSQIIEIEDNPLIEAGPCRPPEPEPLNAVLRDTPSPAAWIKQMDESADGGESDLPWVPIRDEYRLSHPIDFVCPYCRVPIQANVTGNLRCYFCGRTVHPYFEGYGSNAAEHLKAENRKNDLHKFIRKLKY